ncbi:MAG: acyl-CoA synthetase [Pseudomonadota bacterium]
MTHVFRQAAATPDRPAIIMSGSGRTVTFGELEDASNRAAQALRALGLRPGDHMAILMENRPEFMELAVAALRAGVYFTAVSRYLSAEEAAYIVKDCGAKAFVTSKPYAEVGGAAARAAGPGCRSFMLDGENADLASWEALRDSQPAERIEDETKGSLMLYSSGTTGRPKGIKRPYVEEPIDGANPLMELICLKMGGMRSGDVYLSPAPLYHAAPLAATLVSLYHGATAVIMERFDPEGFLRDVERFRVSHAQLVPTMFVRMLKLPDPARAAHDVSSLRCAIHAAAPCPVEVKRAMIDWWGPILLEYYAGTEANGVALCDSHEWLAHPGTVGKSRVGPVRIVDVTGEELPQGETGAVYFEGGQDFEYHNDAAKTAGAYHPKGWSTLGDIGYLDVDEYLHLTDRRAYTIITGGVNVYPQETEDRLILHPEVLDAAVFGVPDEDLGEAVKAVVQPRDPARIGENLAEELAEWCRKGLSRIKCPRSIDFREALPRTETGKLLKRKLKDEYWAAAGR